MRIVVFGSSIVSDLGNPIATSTRPILARMIELGHDVVFLEERNNPWLVGLLKTRGLTSVHAFAAAHPMIQHRTYEIPRGLQWTVQFAQHVGTTDAIIALPGAPEPVFDQIGSFRSTSVVRGVFRGPASTDAEVFIGPVGQYGNGAVFGPAVAQRPPSHETRSGMAVVAYDAAIGAAAADALSGLNPLLVDQTAENLRGWSYLPETVLPSWFDHRAFVVIAGDWRDPMNWARLLLPMASGCRVAAVGPGAEAVAIPDLLVPSGLSQLHGAIRELSHNDTVSRIPEQFDASRQAVDLLGALRQVHEQKRRARG
jgi:hypothetical protein